MSADKAAERAEFEQWAIERWSLAPDSHRLERNMSDEYYDTALQAAWEAWQAGRSSLESENARLREELKLARAEIKELTNLRRAELSCGDIE